ncbi:MAG TPA: hypothetical protein VLT51_00720 [Anaerolineales bacterium]|nr:hypothetical protein [Anaerolineales bacterium]
MNFDFGEILTRAGQITWKHKILWLFSALPVLLSFLILPLVFLPIFLSDFDPYGEPFFVDQPAYILLFIGFSFFISILSFVLYAISSSSVTVGVVQVEGGIEKLETAKLFDDGKKYWMRILGVMLLIGLAISLVFLVIFGCMSLIGAVTMGLGFICMQPLFLLMYPVMIVLYGFIEESQAAVVVDDLGVTDAIRRGWELVKANFWRILLISFIVYLGVGILSSIVVAPFMIPFFFMPFFMDVTQPQTDMRAMMLVTGGISLLLVPVMALVQGVSITFLKTTYTLVYLRLTRSAESQSLIRNAIA